MRLAFVTSALCLSTLGLGLLTLAAQPVVPQPPVPAASHGATSAAAARHLKRTACLKEATAKKLIGADKTAFLKTCIDAPQDPISASRQTLPDRP